MSSMRQFDEFDDTHYCHRHSPLLGRCRRSPGVVNRARGREECDGVTEKWISGGLKRGGPAPSALQGVERITFFARIVLARLCMGRRMFEALAGLKARHGQSSRMDAVTAVLHHFAPGCRLMASSLLYLMQSEGVRATQRPHGRERSSSRDVDGL
jgi:hypothetical protein